MKMPGGRLVLALLLAAGATSAGGQARETASANGLTNAMRSLYAQMFGEYAPTETMTSLQKQAREEVADADLDGGGLSRRDIELARSLAEASARADRVRQYFGSDLNHDGVLTLAEYEARLRTADVQSHYMQYELAREANRPPPGPVGEGQTRDNAHLVQIFNDVDADRDGRLTMQEAFAYNQPVVYGPAERFVEAEKYLVLDRDGDGNVTMAEVDATSAAYLAEQTRAGVGPLPQEMADKEDGARPRLEDVVQCRVPTPTEAARIVRLGTREGGQLSNLAVGGQDEPTYSVSIEIEPGAEPLYIVATGGGPTIWRLSGATHRIEAFIASSRERDARSMWPAVGVTRLARARFHAVPHACFGDFDEGNMRSPLEASEGGQLIQRRLGRPIDVAFGAYQPQGVRLPSAEPFAVPAEVPDIFRNPRSERAASEWRDHLGHFPGGIARLNPRQVVSRAVPEPYEVYSYEAGVAQLLELGALTPVSSNSDLVIRRQIRFPAGLAGGFSEVFRLPDGVPPPIGYPAHSRVMSDSNPAICLIGCR